MRLAAQPYAKVGTVMQVATGPTSNPPLPPAPEHPPAPPQTAALPASSELTAGPRPVLPLGHAQIAYQKLWMHFVAPFATGKRGVRVYYLRWAP